MHCRKWILGHDRLEITDTLSKPGHDMAVYYHLYPGSEADLEEQVIVLDDLRIDFSTDAHCTLTDTRYHPEFGRSYVSFMVSAVVVSPRVKAPDLVISTSPQFFSACAAYLISRMKQILFVFELRDIWPESIKAVGAMKSSLFIRMLEKIELFLYHHAVKIVSVTHSFKNTLIRRGIPGDKITVVTNGADLERFRPRPKDADLVEKYGLENKFVAGYIGTHGMAHCLETILEAAEYDRKNLAARMLAELETLI